MKEELKFCELSSAYSSNIYNLNEARKVFEEECRQFNEQIEDMVKDHRNSHNTDKQKFLTKIFTWGAPQPWSTLKEGSWTRYVQGTSVELNLRVPSKQRFDNNIASLRFQISFSDELRRFVFVVKFENKYSKNEIIDERIIEKALKKPAEFPSARHIKASTGLISVWELDQKLIDNLNFIITNSMTLVEEAISELYPQSAYGQQQLEVTSAQVNDEPEVA